MLGQLRAAVRGWGTTAEERAARLPCDDLVSGEHLVVDRAVDVDADPAAVFRWLCQLRVAPYSYDWIDNFGRRSPRTLTPGLENLAEGQRFMTIFRLRSWTQDEQITLIRGSHLAVTYRVTPGAEGRPGRLHMRARWRSRIPGMALGDLVMSRKQLLTISELARRVPATSAGAHPRPGSRAPSARGRG
jgi:hypothetical protein